MKAVTRLMSHHLWTTRFHCFKLCISTQPQKMKRRLQWTTMFAKAFCLCEDTRKEKTVNWYTCVSRRRFSLRPCLLQLLSCVIRSALHSFAPLTVPSFNSFFFLSQLQFLRVFSRFESPVIWSCPKCAERKCQTASSTQSTRH